MDNTKIVSVMKGQVWNFKKSVPYIINQHGYTAKIDSVMEESDSFSRLIHFTVESGDQLCWEEDILRAYATLSEN